MQLGWMLEDAVKKYEAMPVKKRPHIKRLCLYKCDPVSKRMGFVIDEDADKNPIFGRGIVTINTVSSYIEPEYQYDKIKMLINVIGEYFSDSIEKEYIRKKFRKMISIYGYDIMEIAHYKDAEVLHFHLSNNYIEGMSYANDPTGLSLLIDIGDTAEYPDGEFHDFCKKNNLYLA